MDYQNDIVPWVIPDRETADAVLHRAARVLDAARGAGVPIIYVVVQFRAGYPEVADRGVFKMVKAMNRMVEGTEGAAIHAAVAPKGGDVIVTKRRVGAFSGSDLDCVLRASGRTHLVLFGITTSGVVLSTVRAAADLDYEMNVVSDCCADRDPAVHQILLEKIFAMMAPAITADEVIAALGAA
jgi:nicotinamidase-related amidase